MSKGKERTQKRGKMEKARKAQEGKVRKEIKASSKIRKEREQSKGRKEKQGSKARKQREEGKERQRRTEAKVKQKDKNRRDRKQERPFFSRPSRPKRRRFGDGGGPKVVHTNGRFRSFLASENVAIWRRGIG